jgi:NAD(P)-dependent dehydrogenase (short-subunit alcohol dehydrogenase family)
VSLAFAAEGGCVADVDADGAAATVADEGQVEALLAATRAACGRLDIAGNNAARLHAQGPTDCRAAAGFDATRRDCPAR